MTKTAQKDSCKFERNLRKSINNKNFIDLKIAVKMKDIKIFSLNSLGYKIIIMNFKYN
jgi:hypothetical protein